MPADVDRLLNGIRQARQDGDKALGRELYHQLQDLGFDAQAVDATVADPDVPLVRAVDPNPYAGQEAPTPPETTQAPEPEEKAVKPAPKRRTKSSE
jgi:hypothetical protein